MNNYSGISSAQKVYQVLYTKLMACEIHPGQLLSKQEIAAQFGVSQGPVRDAILRLETEGLVNIYPQSKTVASLIDVKQAYDIHFVRMSSEVEAGKILAKSITDNQLRKLRIWIERQKVEVNSDDKSVFSLMETNFHNQLFELAGVKGVFSLIQAKCAHYDRIRELSVTTLQNRNESIEGHEGILESLSLKDLAKVEASIRNHLEKALSFVGELKTRFPNYFLPDLDGNRPMVLQKVS